MSVAVQLTSFLTNFHGFFATMMGSILSPSSTPIDVTAQEVEVEVYDITDGDTNADTVDSDNDSIAGDDVNQVYHLPPFDPLEADMFVPLGITFEREEGEGYGPNVEVCHRSLNKQHRVLTSSQYEWHPVPDLDNLEELTGEQPAAPFEGVPEQDVHVVQEAVEDVLEEPLNELLGIVGGGVEGVIEEVVAVEEAIEEAIEEVIEEVIEENIEETVEGVVEVATEQLAEEVIEEPNEEVIEEVVEEIIEYDDEMNWEPEEEEQVRGTAKSQATH